MQVFIEKSTELYRKHVPQRPPKMTQGVTAHLTKHTAAIDRMTFWGSPDAVGKVLFCFWGFLINLNSLNFDYTASMTGSTGIVKAYNALIYIGFLGFMKIKLYKN